MAIAAGSRFGPYELISLLGAGGMGEVYRAHDPRLRRYVALKVLTSSRATDADRLRRFQQEAQATSQLNHPNILAVYDVGQQDGIPYIVSELLEGETLRQRITRERLPLRRAIELAIQIARGLAAAHERGIIHRDLKPENIFITRDGHTKILDFGLAKLVRSENAAKEGTTLTLNTEAGVMLGTVGYLSPEQARGLPTDHRTDIFSFGAILYEMVTGCRAFQAKTAADTIANVLTVDPPLPSESDHRIPTALDRIILHALEKDPDQRFQTVRDVIFALEGITNMSSAVAAIVPGAFKRRWPAAVILILLTAAGLLSYLWLRPRPVPVRQTAAPVLLQRLTDFVGMEQSPAVSPDGKAVAFSGGAGTPHIWVRLLAGGAPLKITRDDVPHFYPRWSPDSGSVIYFSPSEEPEPQGGAIYDIPALGGSPRRLATSFTGGDISHDGKRIAYFRRESDKPELVVADRNGSNPRALAALAQGYDYGFPRWSPDDRLIAFRRGRVFNYDVFTIATSGGEPRQITHDLKFMAGYSWLPDGSGILCSSSRNTTALYLPNMDLFVAKLDGSPVRQLTFGDTSFLDPDVDSNGRVFVADLRRDVNVWEFSINGSPADNVRRAIQVTNQTGQVQTPSLSPDGGEMVYLSESGGHSNLWVMKLDGSGEVRQITFEQDPRVAVGVPVWSPDGRHITFFTRRPGTKVGDQWVVDPDGSNLRRLVAEGGWAAWSHDGKWLYISPQGREGEPYRITKVPVDGGEPVQVRTDSSFIGSAPAPDGKTLYFLRMSSRAGGQEVEIHLARPEGAPSQLLARIPAPRLPLSYLVQPVVSPDGKWLALMLADGVTTNIYLLSTSGGPLRQVTDFGKTATEIARRVSWSSDSKHIYAAVARMDADVVVIMNLLQR
ncbi:MAG: serine/threonine-protein kinase [Acidobacteriia bacterium]|nr:serine/threonine-protein kinase [Terriglobia bacterium]